VFQPSFSQHTPWSRRESSNPFFSDGLICVCSCVIVCFKHNKIDSTNFKWILYTSYTENLNQRKLLGLFFSCLSLCVTVYEMHLALFLSFMYPHFGITDLSLWQLAILLVYFPLLGSTFDEYEVSLRNNMTLRKLHSLNSTEKHGW